MDQPPQECKQLPYEVRVALIRASKIPNIRERLKAIEEIEAKARGWYPQLYR